MNSLAPLGASAQRLAKAAQLAGLLTPGRISSERADLIARAIAPTISDAIAAELEVLRDRLAARDREEREILAACHAVGAAVDRLEQARHTSGEIPARKALERAAIRLRKAIQRKDIHASR